MNDEKITLTVPEVAKILRIGRASAYELAKQPGFPVIKIGKQLRIPSGQLEIWLLKQTIQN